MISVSAPRVFPERQCGLFCGCRLITGEPYALSGGPPNDLLYCAIGCLPDSLVCALPGAKIENGRWNCARCKGKAFKPYIFLAFFAAFLGAFLAAFFAGFFVAMLTP
jgi:hypothetical protein